MRRGLLGLATTLLLQSWRTIFALAAVVLVSLMLFLAFVGITVAR